MSAIMQGDAYGIAVKLKDKEGAVLTDTSVSSVVVVFGGVTKVYPGEVVWNADEQAFIYPMEQEETLEYVGPQRLEIRAKFADGNVVGRHIETVDTDYSSDREVR